MTTTSKNLVWFRHDLRCQDNPALYHACAEAQPVVAVFLMATAQWQAHHVSARRTAFTLAALHNLQLSLASLGIPLHVLSAPQFGDAAQVLGQFCAAEKIGKVFCNYEYALDETNRDKAVATTLAELGIEFLHSNASVIIPPGKVTTQQGQAYKVFTPFKRAWRQRLADYDRAPLPCPAKKVAHKPEQQQNLVACDNTLLPFSSEAAAREQLQRFLQTRASHYKEQRDIPAIDGTSQLSHFLTVGVLSPRTCLHEARMLNKGELDSGNEGVLTWVNELIWREFYLHLLAMFPAISKGQPFKPETERVPWRHDKNEFQRWCEGNTGFPLVDAAMRQLNETGWMHNRLRMVVATFLTKYLLIDWRWGEQYFMEQLLDGHFAANNGGWQWSASTGTDAAPYFRILHPVRQAERFDPDATFIKQFLPTLQHLPAKVIHNPGHADLLAAGYPAPMVDLAAAKQRCLAAFKFALAFKNAY